MPWTSVKRPRCLSVATLLTIYWFRTRYPPGIPNLEKLSGRGIPQESDKHSGFNKAWGALQGALGLLLFF